MIMCRFSGNAKRVFSEQTIENKGFNPWQIRGKVDTCYNRRLFSGYFLPGQITCGVGVLC